MNNRFYTLVSTLVQTLQDDANLRDAGTLIELGRIRPYSEHELPAIAVFYVGDAAVGEYGPQNLTVMDWDVQVGIEMAIDASASVTTDEFQHALLQTRAHVHAALMAQAPSQGLEFVLFTAPMGGGEPALDDAGKLKTAGYRSEWLFRVRTAVADLTN